MIAENRPLDELRREIDAIDDQMHDMLMRRTEIARAIGAAKGSPRVFIRPGREARVLRRLISRHSGLFPRSVVVRIWREIMSVFSALQGPFAVAASAREIGPDLRQIARDHFGSQTPITAFESNLGVLRAVTEGQASVGVLPLPDGEEPDPWWRHLAREGDGVPRIVARLPFAAVNQVSSGGLAVALTDQEQSGEDRSFVIIEAKDQISRDTVKSLLIEAGFEVVGIQSWSDGSERPLHLIEVEGFVSPRDPRLQHLNESDDSPINNYWAIGGYAVPLSEAELAPARASETSR